MAKYQTTASKLEQLEGEIRGIKKHYEELSTPSTSFRIIGPKTPIQGLRYGGVGFFTYPDEVILDKVYVFAQRVWQFKDYIKSFTGQKEKRNNPVEQFAGSVKNLLICADLGNAKKHCDLDHPRTKLSPQLGVFTNEAHIGVVQFDTSKNGMVEFTYDGRRKRQSLGVQKPIPIPFRVDIIVSDENALSSKGDAVEFIYTAFKQWEPLLKKMNVTPRPDFI